LDPLDALNPLDALDAGGTRVALRALAVKGIEDVVTVLVFLRISLAIAIEVPAPQPSW
jgi:hypothetical protein